jgi:hypothetical protein
MRLCTLTLALIFFAAGEDHGFSGDLGGSESRPLMTLHELEDSLPSGTMLMMHPAAIEQFLGELDERPPDWVAVYGQGHHDPGHDDRLYALNRERDAKRQGRPALLKQVAFAWSGTLFPYDAAIGGYPVAIGPKFVKTSWGMVRFKPEEAPGNLSVAPDASRLVHLQRLLEQGEPVDVDVIMTGKLVPEESIVYDFSHDEEGLGLIMPFVKVERVDFVLPKP